MRALVGGNTEKIVKLEKKFCCPHGIDIVSLNVRFSYHTLLLFYQIKSKICPTYLSSVLPHSLKESSCYNLRRIVYPVPILNRQSSFKSFCPRAVILWNSLPQYVQVSASLAVFKKATCCSFKHVLLILVIVNTLSDSLSLNIFMMTHTP